jgi:hypothetical protein
MRTPAGAESDFIISRNYVGNRRGCHAADLVTRESG